MREKQREEANKTPRLQLEDDNKCGARDEWRWKQASKRTVPTAPKPTRKTRNKQRAQEKKKGKRAGGRAEARAGHETANQEREQDMKPTNQERAQNNNPSMVADTKKACRTCTQTTCRTRNQAAVQNMKPSDTQDKICF
jgi:hypothetical protein